MAKKQKRNKGGRPPKAPEDRRDQKIEIAITASERDTIVEAAGENVSKWARDILLKQARRK